MDRDWIKVIPLSSMVAMSGHDLKSVVKHMQINRRTWENWISGKTAPNPYQREQLAELLGVDIGAINAAVAENQRRWEEYQKHLERARKEEPSTKQVIIETIIQIIVSVVTSVIVSLKLSGKF